MKTRSYTADNLPFISDIPLYVEKWVVWWTSCQPSWRRGQGWPLPRSERETTNWFKIGARGQNRLFLVVISTAFWAHSIRSEEQWTMFDEAVDDVNWVIGQITASLKTPARSLPEPTPPAPAQKSQPTVPWMNRPLGKRQPKLSRKLLEAVGS